MRRTRAPGWTVLLLLASVAGEDEPCVAMSGTEFPKTIGGGRSGGSR